METKLPVADPAPYPPVLAQSHSPMCARAVLSALGGNSSEMSTVAQYLYSATVLAPDHPKAAEYFRKIAIVEMRHLSIFGELALQFGGDPRLWSYVNGRPAYWSAAVLTYSHELPVLLNRALTGENRAITEYRQLAEQLPDPQIKEILERIIQDEEKHVLIFRNLIKESRFHR